MIFYLRKKTVTEEASATIVGKEKKKKEKKRAYVCTHADRKKKAHWVKHAHTHAHTHARTHALITECCCRQEVSRAVSEATELRDVNLDDTALPSLNVVADTNTG